MNVTHVLVSTSLDTPAPFETSSRKAPSLEAPPFEALFFEYLLSFEALSFEALPPQELI